MLLAHKGISQPASSFRTGLGASQGKIPSGIIIHWEENELTRKEFSSSGEKQKSQQGDQTAVQEEMF